MSTVRITKGACGFTTVVEVRSRGKGKPFEIIIESECEAVERMAEEIRQLDRMDALKGFLQNPVYRAAARHLKHVACPVPSGILMALEVEAGLNVPSGARIEFIDSSQNGSLES